MQSLIPAPAGTDFVRVWMNDEDPEDCEIEREPVLAFAFDPERSGEPRVLTLSGASFFFPGSCSGYQVASVVVYASGVAVEPGTKGVYGSLDEFVRWVRAGHKNRRRKAAPPPRTSEALADLG